MSQNADIGYNSIFSIWNGSAYVAVADVTSITWPGYSRDAVESTDMASPNQFREYIAGMMAGGVATIELNFVPAVADRMVAAMVAGLGQFQIQHKNGVKLQFFAVVTNYQPSLPVDGKMTASPTFQVSGRPVLTL
jgi:predicted secreted protein